MLEKLLVISSKKEAFNWLLLIVVDADLDTDDDVNAETDLMEVLRNAATEQRKTMAVRSLEKVRKQGRSGILKMGGKQARLS
mmetsp:Transcript_1384/g.3068  ORF Transcript_1384/g.3068 Transcript_1384/m.3068 type:complete len:82 (+) Transcript_1384:1279-1524(+)